MVPSPKRSDTAWEREGNERSLMTQIKEENREHMSDSLG